MTSTSSPIAHDSRETPVHLRKASGAGTFNPLHNVEVFLAWQGDFLQPSYAHAGGTEVKAITTTRPTRASRILRLRRSLAVTAVAIVAVVPAVGDTHAANDIPRTPPGLACERLGVPTAADLGPLWPSGIAPPSGVQGALLSTEPECPTFDVPPTADVGPLMPSTG